jgi:AGCS family alanine or glycine:cation symporter
MLTSLESTLYPFVAKINVYLSNYILVFLLLGVGIWYTIRTKFVQVRCFKEGIKNTLGEINLFGKKHDNGMSSFQALSTAIAAQVGTGNIVGASGAILIGGPGAIFWMWIISLISMATKFVEVTLAVEYREKNGRFTLIEDIQNVSGIGKNKFEKMKDYIKVK